MSSGHNIWITLQPSAMSFCNFHFLFSPICSTWVCPEKLMTKLTTSMAVVISDQANEKATFLPPCLVWSGLQAQTQQLQLQSLKSQNQHFWSEKTDFCTRSDIIGRHKLKVSWLCIWNWHEMKINKTNKQTQRLLKEGFNECSLRRLPWRTHGQVGQLVVGAVGENTVQVSSSHIHPTNNQGGAYVALIPAEKHADKSKGWLWLHWLVQSIHFFHRISIN